MRGAFTIQRKEALGVLMPPSYVSATVEERPYLFKYLGRVEAAIACWPGMVCLADHYLLVVRKNC